MLSRLALHHPLLQALLPTVLACEADPSKEVMLAASHAVACVVLAAPPQKVIDILSAMLPSSNEAAAASAAAGGALPPPLLLPYGHAPLQGNSGGSTADAGAAGEVVCAACRCVQRLAHCAPAEELEPRVALDLLPGLVRACDHARADVRKAAVFALAEMWHKLGDARFSEHLARLGQQQHHLVSWAYERIKNASLLASQPQAGFG